ncbi:restriction endonuclease [Mycobacterium attenuatum]|uniref:restriction endonuclease n=1 Tax=Mycobacterium attenuatum TaxID=2341086 RepID=UPI000F0244DD|nr:restriction endonuclease [Mycobacterium attenuatum]VBA47934.1 hypothetical protein LAUMK41_00644 [Mycobacterium attenuatum]
MPPRSNEFQRLITMLTQLMGRDAVTESKELIDLVSGEPREVDIYAEGTLLGQTVRMSIECRDHKRKQSVGWVEEMHSKHERLPTHTLILVSSSGFTRSAVAKADSYGIKTITPTHQSDSELVGEVLASLGDLTLTFTPMSWSNMRSQATVDLPTAWLENPSAHGVHMDDGQFQFYKSDGSPLVTSAAFSSDVLNRVLDQQLAAQPELMVAGNEFNLEVPQFLEPTWAGEPLHMYWTADGEEPILVRVVMLALSGTGSIPVQPQAVNISVSDAINYDGKNFVTGATATPGGNQGRLVMGEEVAGERHFAVDLTVHFPPQQSETTGVDDS